jgi:hypothetical protein
MDGADATHNACQYTSPPLYTLILKLIDAHMGKVPYLRSGKRYDYGNTANYSNKANGLINGFLIENP